MKIEQTANQRAEKIYDLFQQIKVLAEDPSNASLMLHGIDGINALNSLWKVEALVIKSDDGTPQRVVVTASREGITLFSDKELKL